ncbi:MAG: hypothetical protein V1779_17730 [bacterium]
MPKQPKIESKDEKNGDIQNEYSQKAVNLITEEIHNYENGTINLSDNVEFSQYQTVQNIITQQNKGFLTELAPGQSDDREYYDIVSPMIETAVSNIDIDTDNIEPYTDSPEYLAHEYVARVKLRNFLRQTNHGTVLNEIIYQFVDDGNIIVRKVDNDGEIYRPVLPANLYVIDQSARTLEDTAVIEKDTMNQTEVRDMKEWNNKEKVYEMCNVGDSGLIPYYEIFYRYGEISKETLGKIKEEVHGTKYDPQDNDANEFVQALMVMAKAKSGTKDENNNQIDGIIVFAEELIPEEIKITRRLKVKRYKPYEFARLGKFNGRFWGEGYRETAMPYQNRANELGNQIRKVMKLASKMVFWSSDDKIAGKNILSSIKNGQILKAKDLQLLNNIFPNLSLYAEEWNRNIDECTKALKAFEVATGENMPSSTSATAVAVQNQAVGKYYNFKRERFGLFISSVFKRWVLPELTKITDDEDIELTGDISQVEAIIEACAKGWVIKNYMKTVALSGGIVSKQDWEQLVEVKKQEWLKNPKNYIKVFKDFFKDIELYVGINTTGEAFNKQARISNMLQLLQYELNPALQANPAVMDTINDIKQMLGLKPTQQTQPAPQQQPQATPQNQGRMPMKEKSLQENGSDAMSNMV